MTSSSLVSESILADAAGALRVNADVADVADVAEVFALFDV